MQDSGNTPRALDFNLYSSKRTEDERVNYTRKTWRTCDSESRATCVFFPLCYFFWPRLEAISGSVGTWHTKTLFLLNVVVTVIVIVNYCHLCHASNFVLAPCVNRYPGEIKHFVEVYQDKDVAYLDLQKKRSSFAVQYLICVSPGWLVPQAPCPSLPS